MRKMKEKMRRCYVIEKLKFNRRKLVYTARRYSHEPQICRNFDRIRRKLLEFKIPTRPDAFRTHPYASGRIRKYPDASETHPESVPAPPKSAFGQ